MYSWVSVVLSWTVTDTHQSLASLILLNVQFQLLDLGGGSMHYEELPCLDVIGLYFLLWPAYYTNGVSDDWQGVRVDGPA